MTAKSNVERTASLWRMLMLKADRLPLGGEKAEANKSVKTAFKNMCNAIDAADAHAAWAEKQHKPER